MVERSKKDYVPGASRVMRHPYRRLSCVAIGACLLLGGCKQQPANTAPAAAPGSPSGAVNQSQQTTGQLNIPPQPGYQTPTPATPQGTNGLSGPGPVQQQQPQPIQQQPPAPSPVYTVPSGTRLTARIGQTISAKDNNVGDGFSGTLVRAVLVNGVTVLPAGTPVSGTVVAAKGQGRFKGTGTLAIALTSIGSSAVTTSAFAKTAPSKGKRTAGFIGGGGGAGALIGGLAGGGKGALIGGLLGAGAGTAGAAYTGNDNVVIPAESVVSFSLTAPLRVVGR